MSQAPGPTDMLSCTPACGCRAQALSPRGSSIVGSLRDPTRQEGPHLCRVTVLPAALAPRNRQQGEAAYLSSNVPSLATGLQTLQTLPPKPICLTT